jgi:hypothetical protein
VKSFQPVGAVAVVELPAVTTVAASRLLRRLLGAPLLLTPATDGSGPTSTELGINMKTSIFIILLACLMSPARGAILYFGNFQTGAPGGVIYSNEVEWLAVPSTVGLTNSGGGVGIWYNAQTNASFTISSFKPLVGTPSNMYLQVSNSSVSAITATITAPVNVVGTSSSTTVSIPAGKLGWFYVDSFNGATTNLSDAAQSN